jgi:hypothetical protein
MQIYTHVMEEVQKETAAKMDAILPPAPAVTDVVTNPISKRAN